jgi:four helix bundle protein
MQNVHKLAVYHEARQLAIATYRLTADFPSSERFGLTQQMRRAVISIGSNIAEGCGRSGSRALLPFLHYAIGSVNELTFQVEIATELGHCSNEDAHAVIQRSRERVAC